VEIKRFLRRVGHWEGAGWDDGEVEVKDELKESCEARGAGCDAEVVFHGDG
jgi:hypothetical protein